MAFPTSLRTHVQIQVTNSWEELADFLKDTKTSVTGAHQRVQVVKFAHPPQRHDNRLKKELVRGLCKKYVFSITTWKKISLEQQPGKWEGIVVNKRLFESQSPSMKGWVLPTYSTWEGMLYSVCMFQLTEVIGKP